RRHREHATELAATENPDGRVGADGLRNESGHAPPSPDGASATASVWRLRHASRRPASALSWSANTLAASSAALMAPARPRARVRTGTPGGICTIEQSESIPAKALDSTGTPNTGSTVIDAVMPGRCAAPPAPAMMT